MPPASVSSGSTINDWGHPQGPNSRFDDTVFRCLRSDPMKPKMLMWAVFGSHILGLLQVRGSQGDPQRISARGRHPLQWSCHDILRSAPLGPLYPGLWLQALGTLNPMTIRPRPGHCAPAESTHAIGQAAGPQGRPAKPSALTALSHLRVKCGPATIPKYFKTIRVEHTLFVRHNTKHPKSTCAEFPS